MSRKTGGGSASGKAAFFLIFAAGLIALALYLIQMDQVTLEGTRYVDQDDTLDMLYPAEDRRLSAVLYDMLLGPKRDLLFDSIRIRPSGIGKVRITVKENPSDCLIKTDESYAVVNRNGAVVCMLPEPPEELTVLMGLDIQAAERYQQVSAADDALFRDALELAQMVRTSGIPCETIFCQKDDFIFVTGSITIRFGSQENTEEKLAAILDLYPSLVGLKGTLHVEDHNGEDEDGKYYFEVGH